MAGQEPKRDRAEPLASAGYMGVPRIGARFYKASGVAHPAWHDARHGALAPASAHAVAANLSLPYFVEGRLGSLSHACCMRGDPPIQCLCVRLGVNVGTDVSMQGGDKAVIVL
jgi:hypothetical protein